MLKTIAAITAGLVLSVHAMPDGAAHADLTRVDPSAAGWQAAALDALIDYVASQKSTGLLVIQDRQLIAEKTWPLPADAAAFRATFVHGQAADGALLEDVASLQKSFVAVLVGIGIDKGLLDLAQPVSRYVGAGWSKATAEQEAAITVRHLMEMNSGLTEGLAFDTPPGARFFYNTPAYAVLKAVLAAAAHMPLDTLTQAWLAGPAGMQDTGWRQRPSQLAGAGNPSGLVTTPRDLARLGQLVLDHGVARGARVISARQLEALFARSTTNPSYGRLWWLNGGAETIGVGLHPPRRPGPFIAVAPADLVAATGALDRRLFVVPSLRLIVVRTGRAAPDPAFNDTLWRLVARAMPAH